MLRLALVVSMLAAASPALADSSVVVLGVRSIEGDDNVANDLTQHVRESARSIAGWQVSDRAVSMAQMSLAHGCDDLDASCLGDIARSLEASRIIYGTLRRTSSHADYDFSVSLSLFDAETGAIVRSLDQTIARREVEGGGLRQQTDQLVARLGSASVGGVIDIQVNTAEADVLVNGQAAGRTHEGALRLDGLQAGQYRVEILKEGYASHVSVLEIADGSTTTISAVLAQSASAAEGGEFSDTFYSEPRPGPDLQWLGWTLVGVGGASLVGAVVSMFIIKSIDEDQEFLAYRDAVARGNADATNPADLVTDVCDAARSRTPYSNYFMGDVGEVADMCDRADTFEVLQWVFLGTAVAAGGAGVYILLTSDDGAAAHAPGPSLALQPSVSSDRALVRATLRF
jgi:hypothetical protein